MKIFAILVFLSCVLPRAFGTAELNACEPRLLCQPCNSCCQAGQSSAKWNCGSDSGAMNKTEIEEMIDRKVKEGLSRCGLCSNTNETTKDDVIPESCRNIALESVKSRNETGGVFDINIPELGKTEVYCDVTTDGGNWIVFQRRMDGSVDFYREWDDYVNGFGKVDGEFWLGLEAIHQLTKSGSQELRIDMTTKDGTRYYAKYSSFEVGPASDNYKLSANGYSGDATDSFANPSNHKAVLNGMQFSTKDRDNDRASYHCAVGVKGAWWFNGCLYSHLNGLYESLVRWHGVFWLHQTSGKSMYMRFTEMKI